MNRKALIFICVVTLLGLAGLSELINYLSKQTISFDITQAGVNISVSQGSKQVGVLTASGTLRLAKGDYSITPSGSNINTTPITFSVAKSASTIEVHPGYSESYLDQLLTANHAAIQQTIALTYGATLANFKIGNGQLYRDGDWYATILIQNSPEKGNNGDVYRTILQKQGSTWKIMAYPQITISAKDYPTIPRDIINDINQQSSSLN